MQLYYAAVLVGASAAKSLKANNANLEAISKLGNSIFAGIEFLKISKVNFCGKLSYQSLQRFTILLLSQNFLVEYLKEIKRQNKVEYVFLQRRSL